MDPKASADMAERDTAAGKSGSAEAVAASRVRIDAADDARRAAG